MVTTSRGRENQKERTRRGIVIAAAKLIEDGRLPSIPEVAAEALVSPATAYRYFPDQLSLISAALREGQIALAERFQPELSDSVDPVRRVDAATQALLARLVEREPLVRAVMALSLLRTVDGSTPREDAIGIRPGFRRAWIDEALRPVEAELDPAALRLLKRALAVVIGPEALIALADTMGVSREESVDVCRWMARTLTEAALSAPAVTSAG